MKLVRKEDSKKSFEKAEARSNIGLKQCTERLVQNSSRPRAKSRSESWVVLEHSPRVALVDLQSQRKIDLTTHRKAASNLP